jgi:hypothetical protein
MFWGNDTKLLIVPAEGGDGDDGATSKPTAQEKAQIRRAQVRKAQIQHRQRKANYTRQLELDIAGIREMISTTEREIRAMSRENDAMRAQITGAVGRPFAAQSARDPSASPSAAGSDVEMTQFPTASTDLFADIDINDLDTFKISLEVDDMINAPVYQASSSPSELSFGSPSTSLSPQPGPFNEYATSPGLPDLPPEQTQQAINFILA